MFSVLNQVMVIMLYEEETFFKNICQLQKKYCELFAIIMQSIYNHKTFL